MRVAFVAIAGFALCGLAACAPDYSPGEAQRFCLRTSESRGSFNLHENGRFSAGEGATAAEVTDLNRCMGNVDRWKTGGDTIIVTPASGAIVGTYNWTGPASIREKSAPKPAPAASGSAAVAPRLPAQGGSCAGGMTGGTGYGCSGN